MANRSIIWGIHAGRTGDADRLFFADSVIAIGWPRMGDLGRLGNTRDAFKELVAEIHPDMKPGAIPTNAGQMYRFVHEARIGDLVAYPSKLDRCIHLGRIVGEYSYSPTNEPAYPNQRKVEWLRAVPRTSFTQGALYEIGSAMSFFQLRNNAEEFVGFLQKNAPNRIDPESDEASIKVVAEGIQESTNDFVLKRLERELKGHPLADFVGHLLNTMGYRARISPPGADGGIDIIAHRDELGFEPPIIKIQVKSSSDKVSDATVKSLYGNVEGSEFGMFVTLGSFTPPARNFERTRANLRLIDGIQLVDLVLEHYEQLDSRYKGMIPLKRVYVPQPIDEETD